MGTNIDKAPTAIPPIHRPAQMKSMLSFAPTWQNQQQSHAFRLRLIPLIR